MHSIVKYQYSQLSNIHIGGLVARDLALSAPLDHLDLIIIIPCYAEQQIIKVINALNACDRGGVRFEVILLINESEHVETKYRQINEESFRSLENYIRENQIDWPLHVCYITNRKNSKWNNCKPRCRLYCVSQLSSMYQYLFLQKFQ